MKLMDVIPYWRLIKWVLYKPLTYCTAGIENEMKISEVRHRKANKGLAHNDDSILYETSSKKLSIQ
jgi:hypothetical protein